MQGVSFEEETNSLAARPAVVSGVPKISALTKLVFSLKLASSVRDAQYVLLGIAICAGAVAAVIFFASHKTPHVVPPAQLQEYIQKMQAVR